MDVPPFINVDIGGPPCPIGIDAPGRVTYLTVPTMTEEVVVSDYMRLLADRTG